MNRIWKIERLQCLIEPLYDARAKYLTIVHITKYFNRFNPLEVLEVSSMFY